MVSQNTKKLTLSIGKIIGIIAIFLFLVGPFQPYRVTENRTTGETGSSSLTDNWYDNSESVVPFITVILMLILLYPQMPFYFERDSKFGKINHIFLMLWGASFFLSFLRAAIRFVGESSEWVTYPGYGHWMIVLGFFLCGLAGFLAWGGYPKVTTSKDGELVQSEGQTGNQSSTSPEPVLANPTQEEQAQPIVTEESWVTKPEHVDTSPFTDPQKGEAEIEEPTSEKVKILRRWARHIDEFSQTYELCIKCENYAFMKTKDTGDYIVFTCPECKEVFNLKK